MLEKWFQLSRHQTTVRREIVAGVTTFAALAYILAVNPAILSTTGMDRGALVTATALAAAFATVLMGLLTNYPIALAPGMGLNAFFAFTLCQGMGMSWQAALGIVFCSGVLFLILSISGIRKLIIDAIPQDLKIAISCGIGLFIAFIGLKNGGIVTGDSETFVSAGDLSAPSTLLVLFGIVLTGILVWKKVRGAIIIGILILTVLGLFIPAGEGGETVTAVPQKFLDLPASLSPIFLKLDVACVFQHLDQTVTVVLALLFVDLFDTMGTLIGVSHRAGLLDQQGRLPKANQALLADSTGTMAGACLGTSTVTSYIESAAGVEAGGRTGLTALTTAACLLLALFFTPLILAIPSVATAPALVIVGVFMMQGIAELDLKDFAKAVPALLTIILMPLTYSISEGLAIGFVVYTALMLGTGRFKEIHWLAYLLSILFVLHFLFG